jgi:hypothetical protein
MIVQLGVECMGNVRVKETLQKVDEVEYNGSAHYQFNSLPAMGAHECPLLN